MQYFVSAESACMSFEWHRRAQDSIHNAALTNSKRPECFVMGVYPTHVTSGRGCHLTDTDGKRYVDFICGLGSNLFGYGNHLISEAVISQLHKGSVYSLSSTLEVEAAERLKSLFPFVGKVRFLKTGTEAAMGAIRIARAHTGRMRVLSHGYHGHADPFLSLVPPGFGVPKHPDIETLSSLEQIDESVACVIVEPVITDYSDQRREYLMQLKEKCNKMGALLIFDEIITGFRWPNYSVSNQTGITPDVILLGKALGGGLPLSVIATKPKIGDGKEWFVSSTFAGDTLALSAFLKCTDILRKEYSLLALWDSGTSFLEEFNAIAPDLVKIDGYPTRGVFVGTAQNKAVFFQECCKAGILFGPSWFYNFPHMEVKDFVLSTVKDILTRMKSGMVSLEGKMPESPFAEKVRKA